MNDYIGTIKIFAGSKIPSGWILCNGQSLSTVYGQNNPYFALFSIISYAYGGSGANFNLPNLCGRIPVGTGVSAVSGNTYNAGEAGGVENNTIGMNNMPSHTHSVAGTVNMQASSQPATTDIPTGAYYAMANTDVYASESSQGTDMGISYDFGLTSQTTGAGEAYDSRQPYVTVNYIICYQGIYPSRNGGVEDVIGSILPFTGNFVPNGWLACDGKSYSASQYAALFAIISNRYGGSGTNFNVPNLAGAAPIGMANPAAAPGNPQGSESVALTVANIINHTHTVNDPVKIQCSALPATFSDPNDNFPAVSSGIAIYGETGDIDMAPFTYAPHVTSSGATTPAAMENRTPYLAVQYMICAEGYYVSRPQS